MYEYVRERVGTRVWGSMGAGKGGRRLLVMNARSPRKTLKADSCLPRSPGTAGQGKRLEHDVS